MTVTDKFALLSEKIKKKNAQMEKKVPSDNKVPCALLYYNGMNVLKQAWRSKEQIGLK